MPKVGLCLSGCGVQDGSEIHESVIAILALDRAGADILYLAPDMNQHHVINHITGEKMDENRNVLIESARIARGDITDLALVTARDMDALLFPGGFGAALNLCDFGVKGAQCDIHPEVDRIVKEMVTAKKPIGAACIAPAMMSRALRNLNNDPQLTIGTDAGTAEQMSQMGTTHIECAVRDIIVDENYQIVSTPAYMLAGRISEAADGIERMISEVLSLIKNG